MLIAAVSDCHGLLNNINLLPDADVLVIAGDYCPDFNGKYDGAEDQLKWIEGEFCHFLATLNYERIIVVSGNHDFVHYHPETAVRAKNIYKNNYIVYLEDSEFIYNRVKFYGSPWQPWFYDWAFNFPRHDPVDGYKMAVETWSKIPGNTDVLITHGPPYKVLDLTPSGMNVGCVILKDSVLKIRPKLHVFGHIHLSYGMEVNENTTFGNISLCNEQYEPVNKIQVFKV